ncbi:MAG: low molecular weight phosphatase family protein [Richelia sp. RM2_1_2]|nr:low molecular weight phosphatase family protein [Richelia sp. SM2_1_7]NJM17543.1 low molecular weight phosphatase family protein [Richelia sp. SM1_7_0]NJN07466.1 low molecular weight phosphatase family protein [Richelia sp. RM1_1_1]NJO26744.1 low molecular weight phosphatase family protein [Richelia sp. SL_2_1]NJO57408.1 low molecular weight phosphatase family protein [Richelia sp. RM2_1_2]
MKKILFLCTANYFRSRFAELLFNDLARKQGLEWEADSRGIALGRGIPIIGAISWFTIRKLQSQGVILPKTQRNPIQVNSEDFQTAEIIIAMNEAEHRHLMLEKFPEWVDKVEYWNIRDSHQGLPSIALRKLENNIIQLIERLTSS